MMDQKERDCMEIASLNDKLSFTGTSTLNKLQELVTKNNTSKMPKI
jgi:hypothetical protein